MAVEGKWRGEGNQWAALGSAPAIFFLLCARRHRQQGGRGAAPPGHIPSTSTHPPCSMQVQAAGQAARRPRCSASWPRSELHYPLQLPPPSLHAHAGAGSRAGSKAAEVQRFLATLTAAARRKGFNSFTRGELRAHATDINLNVGGPRPSSGGSYTASLLPSKVCVSIQGWLWVGWAGGSHPVRLGSVSRTSAAPLN